MVWVGAVDHVVGRRGSALGVRLPDRVREALTGWQGAVRLDREGYGAGQRERLRSACDPNGLFDIICGDEGDQVDAGGLEHTDLLGMIGLRVRGRHLRRRVVAVAAWAESLGE